MGTIRKLLAALSVCGISIHAGGALAQECTERLLASGYNSDNVHIYDLCDGGSFAGVLDSGGRLDGVQAVRQSGDFLYVASEENDRIVRYSADTLEFVDIWVQTPSIGVSKPTALAVGPDGDIYVGGFQSTVVVRLNPQTGAEVQRYNLGSAINGIDAGMAFGDDGRLLVPGFESDNIIAIDVDSGSTSQFIAAGSGGLDAPRVIVNDTARSRLLVTSWRSSRVLAFAYDGGFTEELVVAGRPTGLVVDGQDTLLVTSDQVARVIRYDSNGGIVETVVESGAGGLDGATFLTVIGTRAAATPVVTEPDQAWLIGSGEFVGNTLVAEMVITDGARFGAAFDPAAVRRQVWGQVEFALIDCDNATFSWSSPDPDYAQGEYAVLRLGPNEARESCLQQGLSPAAASGVWFGGPPRDGEGMMVDVLLGDIGVLTWYTYRPGTTP